MNRNTFKSAYSKLALSEETKLDMKTRLMQKMSAGDGGSAQDEDADSHRAQEVKLSKKKRSPLKTVIGAGSAAAAVALCVVGAGFLLNGDLIPGQSETSTEQAQSAEATAEAVTDETRTVAETDEAYIDDGYYSLRCANGILHFQEFAETTAEHTRPVNLAAETFREHLTGKYPFISSRRLGMDEEYSNQIESTGAAIEPLEGAEAAQARMDEMVAALPLGDELWLSEGRTSDTGIAMIYRSEDDTKQVNFSVSDSPDEFCPIQLPEGGYLMPTGEYRSSFTAGTLTQFMDAETFSMAAGSVTVGDDEYFTAVYAYEVNNYGLKYFRIDGRNITQEQFIACIGRVSNAGIYDHIGFYIGDGVNNDSLTMYGEVVSDDSIAPLPSVVQTEWGGLNMNVVTHCEVGWDGGFSRNITYFGEEDLPEEYSYKISDAAEFAGIDALNEQLFPEDHTDISVYYKASYAELPDEQIAGAGYGANKEMLPGDDPEEYEESRSFIRGVSEFSDGEVDYSYSHYITDKIDYFKDKTRTMAVYSVREFNDSLNRRICVDVFDDWEIFAYMKAGLFARLPAAKTTEFAGKKGELYVCGGPLSGQETYIGCFKAENGRYVVLQTTNAGLQTFAEMLAKLYTNDTAPTKLCECEYPDLTYSLSLPDTIYDTATGSYQAGAVLLNDYSPSPDTVYFSSADEALAAAKKLGGNGAAVLAEDWTLIPEKSGVTQYENGEPAELALYFTNGDKELLAGMSTKSYMDSTTKLRMPLPDGKKIDKVPGYYVYECTMFRKEALDGMLYMDENLAIKAGICGRMVNGAEYYHAETDGAEGIAYMIDSKGLSADEAIDALAALVYQQENPAFIGKLNGTGQQHEKAFANSPRNQVECGIVWLNELSVYDTPSFEIESGEWEINSVKAEQFLEQFGISVDMRFMADKITRVRNGMLDGYINDSVTYHSGDKSVRLSVIENGASMYAYGEQYGVGRLLPTNSILDGYKRGQTLCHPVVSAGTLPDGTEICFGIFGDIAAGIYYTVTTENLSLEEFSAILGQVYLIETE